MFLSDESPVQVQAKPSHSKLAFRIIGAAMAFWVDQRILNLMAESAQLNLTVDVSWQIFPRNGGTVQPLSYGAAKLNTMILTYS